MQSLITKKAPKATQSCCVTTTPAATVAQCCAKISKAVAGCHD
jgi:hypothetical protein